MKSIPKILTPAVRQYQSPDSDEMVTGFDYGETIRIVNQLIMIANDNEAAQRRAENMNAEYFRVLGSSIGMEDPLSRYFHKLRSIGTEAILANGDPEKLSFSLGMLGAATLEYQKETK